MERTERIVIACLILLTIFTVWLIVFSDKKVVKSDENINISSGVLIQTKESTIDGCEYIEFIIVDSSYGEASVLAHKTACANHIAN